MRTLHIDAKVLCRATRGATGVWVGVCDPLNITVEADTWAELQAVTAEAIALLFADLLESGEFERFLAGKGWTPSFVPAPTDELPLLDFPFLYETADGYPSRAGTQLSS